MAAPTRPTRLVPLHVIDDLTATLARLRTARLVGDKQETRISERRLNWLIDNKLPRP